MTSIQIDKLTIHLDVNVVVGELQKTLTKPDPTAEELTDLDFQHAAQHVIEELKADRFARFTPAMAEENRDAFDPNSELWENGHALQSDLGRWVWHDGQFWVSPAVIDRWEQETREDNRHQQELLTTQEYRLYSWVAFILGRLNTVQADEILGMMERTFYGTAGQP